VPDDTALVGDFTKAVLWLREGAQVLATDSHSDFFVKNLVALLAELRAALGVLLPSAFCKVTSVD
jgi:HK97 family phage major capsid protein